MEVKICFKKFQILLEKIFQEKYELDNYYSEKLIMYLEDRAQDSAGKLLLETPIFSDLIFSYLEGLQNASISTKVFIIDLVRILFKNELQFSKLQIQGFQMSSITYCILENLQEGVSSSALHLACINVATAQISHYSGVRYILEYKLWQLIFYPGVETRPMQVSKAAYNFVSKLAWKLAEYEQDNNLIEIIRFIVEPLANSEYINQVEFDVETENTISCPILRSLNALLAILNETEKLLSINKMVPVLKLCLMTEIEFSSVGPPLHRILMGSRDPSIVGIVTDIHFRFYIGMCTNAKLRDGKKENDFCNEIIALYLNCITKLLEKRMVSLILEFVVKCNIYWYKLDASTNLCKFGRDGQEYEMHNQFIMLLTVPLLTFASSDPRFSTEPIEQYFVKLGKLVTEHIFKVGHTFKLLIEQSDMKKIIIHTLKELFNLKGHLNISQAGLLFQSLYYMLVYVSSDDEGCMILDPDHPDMPDNVKLISLLLDALKMLLKEHKIHWYENVEIICLQNGLLTMLKKNKLPNKQVHQVLDLIDLSVKKFLSPDMTLLVESKPDSTLNEMGTVMNYYIQYDDWEIRDSALNLLLSCTHIAFVKYVPFQKIISENRLLILASHVALNDTEFYAQTMALKCLAAATKIDSIWREVLATNRYIYIQLANILKTNSVAMVRKEAANVLTQVYTNQKVTQIFEKYMYDVMTVAALKDLHWEVQLCALNFWKHAIQNQLSNRGMIDGKFPKVTFSKEKRKIIVLEEKEIKRQLSCILNDLSSIGCLTVLYDFLKEDSNIEVMEQAYCIAKEFIEILNYYDFDEVPENELIQPTHDNDEVEMKDESDEDMILDLSCVLNNEAPRDRVIDNIVNTKQVDLIMNLSEKYIHTEVVTEESFLSAPLKDKINPNLFLETFKKTDYLTIIKMKKEWNAEACNLDTLLDEIIGHTETKCFSQCRE